MPGQSRPSWFDHPNVILWEVRIIRFSFMQSPPAPCRVFPIGSKYLPQHQILEKPQPMFLAQYDGPIFLPTQNNRQNYSSVFSTYFYISWIIRATNCTVICKHTPHRRMFELEIIGVRLCNEPFSVVHITGLWLERPFTCSAIYTGQTRM
jgi:hypothetical protein